jgi:hypothetical protein
VFKKVNNFFEIILDNSISNKRSLSVLSASKSTIKPLIQKPVNKWKDQKTNPQDEYGNNSKSNNRKLHLVENNENYKRYQFVSRSRKKINVRRRDGSIGSIQYHTPSKTNLQINDKKYLENSYGPEKFNLKISSLKKSNRKVTIIKNGREYQKELFFRD